MLAETVSKPIRYWISTVNVEISQTNKVKQDEILNLICG